MLKIYLTIPISSAEAERAFSVLKLLKTWLRTAMADERLSDLGVIKMACDLIVDYELILNEFFKIKDRRLKFIENIYMKDLFAKKILLKKKFFFHLFQA